MGLKESPRLVRESKMERRQIEGVVQRGSSHETFGSKDGMARAAVLILEFLAHQSAPCTEKQIMKAVRRRKQYNVTALRELLTKDLVNRCGKGRKADPFRYSLPKELAQSEQGVVIEEIII